jgi:hypothetical protein
MTNGRKRLKYKSSFVMRKMLNFMFRYFGVLEKKLQFILNGFLVQKL